MSTTQKQYHEYLPVMAGRDIYGTSTSALIDASGEVTPQSHRQSEVPLTSMQIIDGKPVILQLVSKLLENGIRTVNVLVKENSYLEKFIRPIFGDRADINFITYNGQGTSGKAGKELLNQVSADRCLVMPSNVLWNFQDDSLFNLDQSFVATPTARSGKHSRTRAAGTRQPKIYGIANWKHFRLCLNSNNGKNDPLHKLLDVALQDYTLSYPLKRYQVQVLNGSSVAESDLSGTASLLPYKRVFNTIEIDPLLQTLTKRSSHASKLRNEFNYFQTIPASLKNYFPQVFSADMENSIPAIEMEYYDYPNLSEPFIYGGHDRQVWLGVFKHLASVMRVFTDIRGIISKEDLHYFYQDRWTGRLDALAAQDDVFDRLINFHNTLTINGVEYLNLPMLRNQLRTALAKIVDSARITAIHGDMCLPNILYSFRHNVCKFVDPRGSFGRPGYLGDIRYDVAKLYHSVHGLYDFIINDLFDINMDDDRFEYRVYDNQNTREVREAFESIFFKQFDRNEILLLEGLLFISMCTFHSDSFQRQIAMYTTGIRILNEALGHTSRDEQ